MGFNTSAIILNDAVHLLPDDHDLGQKIHDAVLQVGCRFDAPSVDIGIRGHANAMTIIESHHADQTKVISVGGNCGQVLGTIYAWDFDLRKPEDKERMLKRLAEELGYTVHKKPSRKVIRV